MNFASLSCLSKERLAENDQKAVRPITGSAQSYYGGI